jgi:excisionase family DNA binding protein
MSRPRRLIVVKEAADYLGISASTLYRLLDTGKIKAIKINSEWRFTYEGLDEWIAAQPPGTTGPDYRRKRRP